MCMTLALMSVPPASLPTKWVQEADVLLLFVGSLTVCPVAGYKCSETLYWGGKIAWQVEELQTSWPEFDL